MGAFKTLDHVDVKGNVVPLRIPDRSKFDLAWVASKPRVIDRIRVHAGAHDHPAFEERDDVPSLHVGHVALVRPARRRALES